jgi:hypothetical protein
VRRLAALLALAASGCGSEPAQAPPRDPAAVEAAPAVHLPQYKPPGQGGPEAFMEAGMGGTLRLAGRCLGFADEKPGALMTIVWPSDARLGSDERGPFVQVGKERVRPGERLRGGGGTMLSDFSDARLTRPFPEECDRSSAVEFHSIEREPWPEPAAVNPPPPTPPPPQ